MIAIKQFLALSILYCLCSASWAQLDIQQLQINDKKIIAEIADTENTRRLGLMNRTELAENHGMLFVFQNDNRHCFWMKNTLIPLSIAFINQHNKIVDIQEMQAQSLATHCPPENINQALEMNSGWFKDNNIHIGDAINWD